MAILDLMTAASRRMLENAELAGITRKRAPGELGRNREDLLRTFLGQYFPGRFAAGTGLILTPNGPTRQQDIVIYDALNHRPFDADSPCPLFPLESVNATIEVKSSLDRGTLKDLVLKTVELKQALRAGQVGFDKRPHLSEPLCGAFAYGGLAIDDAYDALNALQAEVPLVDRLDMLCILGEGTISGGSYFEISKFGEPTSAHRKSLGPMETALREKYSKGMAAWKIGDYSLFVFTHFLLSYISRRPTIAPNWASYLPTQQFGHEVRPDLAPVH